MNGWHIEFVNPNSELLTRSDGSRTIGMTDLNTKTIYISDVISGALLKKVITHEICHAYFMEHNIYVPIYWEELICDLISTYGKSIVNISNNVSNTLCNKYNKC